MMHRHEMESAFRQIAAQVMGGLRQIKLGLTTSVNQSNMAVKAAYQPENSESGFMPHMTPLAGAGWGIVAIPPAGVQVVVGHEDGDGQAGISLGCIWDNNNQPPAGYKPGEIWLVSQGGAVVKVTNDGNVTISGGTITLTGNVQVNGSVTATGEGTFNGGHTVSQHTHPSNGAKPTG